MVKLPFPDFTKKGKLPRLVAYAKCLHLGNKQQTLWRTKARRMEQEVQSANASPETNACYTIAGD